jgi:hypothetical protein
VAAEDDLGTFFDEVLDRRQRLFNARVIRNYHRTVAAGARIERNIEINANEDAFSGKIEVANSFLWHGRRRKMGRGAKQEATKWQACKLQS